MIEKLIEADQRLKNGIECLLNEYYAATGIAPELNILLSSMPTDGLTDGVFNIIINSFEAREATELDNVITDAHNKCLDLITVANPANFGAFRKLLPPFEIGNSISPFHTQIVFKKPV